MDSHDQPEQFEQEATKQPTFETLGVTPHPNIALQRTGGGM